MKNRRPSITKTQSLAAGSLLVVFIIDTITPVEFVFDILYLCCILIVFKQNTKTIICFSTAASILILINLLLIDQISQLSLSAWTNRGISLLAIFITSYIAIHYRKTSQGGKLKEQQYLKALEEMLFITSHQVRKPVANILGLIEIIDTDHADLSAEDLKERCQYLKASAHELDNFIKELNTFIEQTQQKQNRASFIPFHKAKDYN